MMFELNRYTRSLIIAVVVSLGGCAALREGKGTPETEVELKVQQRWAALIKNDQDAAYAMLSPAARSVISKDVYVRKLGLVTWLSAEVKSVKCGAPDLCNVKVQAKYRHVVLRMGVVENDQVINEAWRNVDGEWWFAPADY